MTSLTSSSFRPPPFLPLACLLSTFSHSACAFSRMQVNLLVAVMGDRQVTCGTDEK